MASQKIRFDGRGVHVRDMDGNLTVKSWGRSETVITITGSQAQIDALDVIDDFDNDRVIIDGTRCGSAASLAGLWTRFWRFFFGSNTSTTSVSNVSRSAQTTNMTITGSRSGLKVEATMPYGATATASNVAGSSIG
jgi:hypothetical protein